MTLEEYADAVINDTAPCAGKEEGDACISTVVEVARCSKWDTVLRPEAGCDQSAFDGQLCCIPGGAYCPMRFRLFCEDNSGGDLLMVERFVCVDDDPADVKCVADRIELSQRCNDRIGNTFCDSDSEKESVYRIEAMACEQSDFGSACVIIESSVEADCSQSEQKCEESKKTQPCFGLGENLGEAISNLPEIITKTSAACVEPEPCYGDSFGDFCIPDEPSHCNGNTLYKATGTCQAGEMVFVCSADKEECPNACIENESGAHCE